MRRQTTAADSADTTGTVDFSDNPLTGISAGASDADEFVTEYSAKTHVAATQLKISFADACFQNVHGHFVRPGFTQLSLICELQRTIKDNCSHRSHSESGQFRFPPVNISALRPGGEHSVA
jgi:hypothetical protein